MNKGSPWENRNEKVGRMLSSLLKEDSFDRQRVVVVLGETAVSLETGCHRTTRAIPSLIFLEIP